MSKSRTGRSPLDCRSALVAEAPRMMDTLRQKVLWREGLGSGPCQMLQGIYPLAYLYKTPLPGNGHRGSAEVLETIVQTGDFLCACLKPKRGQSFAASAHSLGATLDWAVLFWLDAYGLIAGDLGDARRRRWKAVLSAEVDGYAGRHRSFMDQGRFNSYSFGTSPNHVISYAADLAVAGVVLKNRAWLKLAEDFTDRFVESQTAAGYWAEGHGPVGGYQSVSLAGVARVAAIRPKALYREALAKALDYHETILYPDYSFVGVIDKRQHYSASPSVRGLSGFSFLPRGRSLAAAMTRASLASGPPASGSQWARLLENYVLSKPGAAPRHRPWRGQRWLEDHTCLVREGRWQYNFSANPVVVHPGSPFRLDCEALYSVWHESVGLIVSGSQDKNRPQHATFYCLGGQRGLLHGGRIGDLCEPKYVEGLYSSNLRGRVEMSLARADTLALAASLPGGRKPGQFFFNMPLRVGAGETVTVDGKPHVLTRRKLAVAVRGGAEVALFGGKVRIHSAAGGRLHFPCMPFNSYSTSHRSKLDQAFARLAVPVGTGADAKPAKIRIRVKT